MGGHICHEPLQIGPEPLKVKHYHPPFVQIEIVLNVLFFHFFDICKQIICLWSFIKGEQKKQSTHSVADPDPT